MTDADTCYLSIADLGRAYRERRLSPVEVTDAHLPRIEAVDGGLRSFITCTVEAARAAACEAERRFAGRQPLGSLDGIPIALKDLYDTAGVRTTAHPALYVDRVPETDASSVRWLAAAGAVPLGKQAMHELAWGSPVEDCAFPLARNPWDTSLSPGGSSSGSGMAVAAGLCAGALGSDSGGSIHWPASFCGIVGLKPTYDLVSRVGMIPLAWSFDHAGPMARTVEDVALLLEAVAEPDLAGRRREYRRSPGGGLRDVRIGVPRAQVEQAQDLHPETRTAYDAALDALARLGARIVPIEIEETEHVRVVWLTIAAPRPSRTTKGTCANDRTSWDATSSDGS